MKYITEDVKYRTPANSKYPLRASVLFKVPEESLERYLASHNMRKHAHSIIDWEFGQAEKVSCKVCFSGEWNWNSAQAEMRNVFKMIEQHSVLAIWIDFSQLKFHNRTNGIFACAFAATLVEFYNLAQRKNASLKMRFKSLDQVRVLELCRLMP